MQRTTIVVNGKGFYVNVKAITGKIGVKGKVTPIPSLYRTLGKGTARKVRKQLRATGYAALASLSAN